MGRGNQGSLLEIKKSSSFPRRIFSPAFSHLLIGAQRGWREGFSNRTVRTVKLCSNHNTNCLSSYAGFWSFIYISTIKSCFKCNSSEVGYCKRKPRGIQVLKNVRKLYGLLGQFEVCILWGGLTFNWGTFLQRVYKEQKQTIESTRCWRIFNC